MVAEDIAAGQAMANVPLPDWVSQVDGVHGADGSWSASAGRRVSRSTLPVYTRQLVPDLLVGEKSAVAGRQVWANEGVRLWVRDDVDPGIAILSVTTKMHSLGRDVILGRQRIAAGHHHIGAGILQYHAQIGGFSFQMNGDDHIDPGQRFGLQKFFIQ